MSVDKKILKEIERHHKINKYILEQEAPLVPGLPQPELDSASSQELNVTPQASPKIDLSTDSEVEKITDTPKDTEGGTEELDITDLVNSQKKIETKQDEYFENLFGYLQNLESKLSEMDNLVTKLNDIESQLEKFRPKTPEEKLSLRTIDSGPFNQKLSDYYNDKKDDWEKSGKHEYILTSDDVQDTSPAEIKKTFRQNNPNQLPNNF